jgi:pimeloyl-ACP methyl ester carboxylesterase
MVNANTARSLGLTLSVLLASVVVVTACGGGTRYPVEAAYTLRGPYATSTGVVTSRSGKALYDLFYPKRYAALGFKSPIITWGNGTGGIPRHFSTLLSHLASYGFAVIASTSGQTGSGVAIAAGARYLVTQNTTSGSVFYRRLNVHRIAAMGTSQGAGGATKAAINNPALITTLVTFSLPITLERTGPSTALLTQPTFFIGTHGPFDAIIAPPWVERMFYNSVTVHAALGIILNSDGKRADHISIENTAYGGNPGGELGYATAWLEYELRGNRTAATAFTGTHPELVSNTNWPGSAAR